MILQVEADIKSTNSAIFCNTFDYFYDENDELLAANKLCELNKFYVFSVMLIYLINKLIEFSIVI